MAQAAIPPPKCDDVLSLCDKALQAKDKELELCDLGLKQTLDQKVQLETEVKDLNDRSSSIFRNPFFLIGLGLVGGVLLAK
jgi:hypothetical protein